MSDEKVYTFRNPAKVAGFARLTIGAMAAIDLVMAAGMVWQYHLLQMMQSGAFATREEMVAWAHASDGTLGIVQWVLRVCFVLALIAYFVWVYRANANVQALGAANLDISPGFAVGVYFIPFANLFYPPQNMHQVWRASKNASAWRDEKGTVLIAVWWTLQIVCGVGAWISLMFGPAAGSKLPALLNFTLYMLVFFLASAVLRVVQLMLVARISVSQIAQHARLQPAA